MVNPVILKAKSLPIREISPIDNGIFIFLLDRSGALISDNFIMAKLILI